MYYKLIFIILFTSFLHAQAQDLQIEVDGQYYSMQERMEAHNINGASLAIVRDFKLQETLQKGFRDKESNLMVDQNTLFQMGSMTTMIIKFAIMRLVSDGRLDLDKPANNYLESWKIASKPFTEENPVTIRDLLLEKRGFNSIYKPTGYTAGEPLPTTIQILEGKGSSNLPPLNLKKNHAKESSMANKVILHLILEDVHDKPLSEVIQEEVFNPLKMQHSVIAAELTTVQKQNACVGYLEDGTRIKGDRRIYPELSHSGLWSTPTDYAKFVLYIFKAARGLDNTLLSQELAEASIQSQNEYQSLVLHMNNGRSYCGGAPKGFYSQFAGNVEEGWIVVSCTNRELAWKFVNQEMNRQIQQTLQH